MSSSHAPSPFAMGSPLQTLLKLKPGLNPQSHLEESITKKLVTFSLGEQLKSNPNPSSLQFKLGKAVMNNLFKRDVSPEEQREINKKIMNDCMSLAGEDQSKTLMLMGSNEKDLDYQQKVELKSDLRRRLQDRFTMKL